MKKEYHNIEDKRYSPIRPNTFGTEADFPKERRKSNSLVNGKKNSIKKRRKKKKSR